jgi:hypothetical protein
LAGIASVTVSGQLVILQDSPSHRFNAGPNAIFCKSKQCNANNVKILTLIYSPKKSFELETHPVPSNSLAAARRSTKQGTVNRVIYWRNFKYSLLTEYVA